MVYEIKRKGSRKFKHINIVKSVDDWISGYDIALDELNKSVKMKGDMLTEAKNIGQNYFFNSSSKPRSRYVIGATSMFIVMKVNGMDLKVKEMSKLVGVTDVSIRVCMREIVKWIEEYGYKIRISDLE